MLRAAEHPLGSPQHPHAGRPSHTDAGGNQSALVSQTIFGLDFANANPVHLNVPICRRYKILSNGSLHALKLYLSFWLICRYTKRKAVPQYWLKEQLRLHRGRNTPSSNSSMVPTCITSRSITTAVKPERECSVSCFRRPMSLTGRLRHADAYKYLRCDFLTAVFPALWRVHVGNITLSSSAPASQKPEKTSSKPATRSSPISPTHPIPSSSYLGPNQPTSPSYA